MNSVSKYKPAKNNYPEVYSYQSIINLNVKPIYKGLVYEKC